MVIDAQHMLAEHARGDSLREIAHNHGISHETVRKVVIERGQSLLRDLTRDLFVAEAGEGRWPTILIPFGQPEADWRDAHTMLFWAVDQLRARDFDIRIVTHQTRLGTIFELTLRRGS